jgi:tRNA pseudouridine55 synthase
MNHPVPCGLLNLRKPAGMSSRGAVDLVARVAKTGRAGHAGTLDPMATGVLLVCIGRATRLVPMLHELRKAYRAEFLLGQSSDTDDTTGNVVAIEGAAIPRRDEIEALLPEFTGRIAQVPPAHSAVHVGGKRAYHLARRGEAVTLAPRAVEVYRLELIEYDWPRLVLDIECGSGTYVRSIGRDLGARLSSAGVMSRLERRAIGHFRVDDGVDPTRLTAENLMSNLLPPIEAVRHLPSYQCPADQAAHVGQGRAIAPGPALSIARDGAVAVVDSCGGLMAVANFAAETGLLQPRLVFVT